MIRTAPLALLAPFFVACDTSAPAPAPGPSSSASATSPVAAASSPPPTKKIRRKWFIPTGPKLAIVPGQGVGPIRFGANVATIERHMGFPCDEKNPKLCRYISRAVDFRLQDDRIVEIVVHRMERELRKDANGDPVQFGVFNGAMPPKNIAPSILKSAAVEELGKPKRVEKVSDAGAFGTLERLHYDDLVLEIDRDERRGEIVGALILPQP